MDPEHLHYVKNCGIILCKVERIPVTSGQARYGMLVFRSPPGSLA